MLKATFLADFDNFTSAVKKAELDLKGMETGAQKVQDKFNAVADSFSGRKIVQDANLVTEAIGRMGGASQLTEREQAKVNRAVSEAIEKYRVLGQQAPQAMIDLEKATRKVESATGQVAEKTTNWKASLGSLASAVGIGFSVGAVVNFGKSVLDSASKIGDLASQLGVSTDAVQGFQFAAEQSGSSIDAVGTALTKMNDKLAGGDKATVSALKAVGLSFSDIRNMKPEDAFLAITDAIQKIEDPMVQTDVALQLFGKSSAELLPAIKEGFRGVSDSANKMSADTIRSLKDAQDAWSELGRNVTIVSGNLIAAAMDLGKAVTSSGASLARFARDTVLFGAGAAGNMAVAFEASNKAAEKSKDIHLGLPAPIRKTAEEMAAGAAAAKKYSDAFNSMFGKFSGASATAEMQMLDAVFRKLASSGKLTETQIDAIVKQAIKLQGEGAKLTPRLWDMVRATDALNPGLSNAALNFSQLGTKVQFTVPAMDAVWQSINKLQPDAKAVGISNLSKEFAALIVRSPADMLKDVQVKTIDAGKALGDLTQALAQLAQVSTGSLGSVVRDLSSLVGAVNTAKAGVESFRTGLSSLKSGDMLSGILNMTTGIIGMASAAIAAGKAIANLFDKNKGRDLVVDFAETFGGFDRLHEELATLGAEGEALWIALTQGVGRNNPAEAQKAIDAITKALDKKKAATEASTVSSEAEAQATIETAAAAAKALDDLSGRLLANADEWGAWSVDVTGYLQKLADDIRNMPLPGPTGPTGGGGSGTGTFAPRRDGGAGSGTETIVIENVIDGELLTRSVVKTAKRRGLA